MSIFTRLARAIFASHDAAGNARQIVPAEVATWGTEIEALIDAVITAGGKLYASKAAMDDDLVPAANTPAIVLGDVTVANNGLYRKVGATTVGSWTRVGDVPGYSYILATNAGAGTANAIVATTAIPIPAADGGALIALPIVAANDASPVTVAFNGGAALTIKTSSGNDPVIGGLTAGMVVAGYKSGTTFRLLSDQASAAVLAGMESLYAEFQTRYLGSVDTLPTTDFEGNPLVAGALVYLTTDGILYVWDGDTWEPMNASLADGAVTAAKITNDAGQQTAILDKLGGTTLGKAIFTAADDTALATAIEVAVTSLFGGTNVVNIYSSGSGNWTIPTDADFQQALVFMLGGGGAGGGATGADTAGTAAAGAGGGSGGMILSLIDKATLAAAYPAGLVAYSVGAAGAGAAGADGGTGGDTTFGSNTAKGGTGGQNMTAVSALASIRAPGTGQANTATLGTIIFNARGSPGTPLSGDCPVMFSGNGAPSVLGGGMRGRAVTGGLNGGGSGDDAQTAGGGGAGGVVGGTGVGVTARGGHGKAGLIVVVEIYSIGAA